MTYLPPVSSNSTQNSSTPPQTPSAPSRDPKSVPRPQPLLLNAARKGLNPAVIPDVIKGIDDEIRKQQKRCIPKGSDLSLAKPEKMAESKEASKRIEMLEMAKRNLLTDVNHPKYETLVSKSFETILSILPTDVIANIGLQFFQKAASARLNEGYLKFLSGLFVSAHSLSSNHDIGDRANQLDKLCQKLTHYQETEKFLPSIALNFIDLMRSNKTEEGLFFTLKETIFEATYQNIKKWIDGMWEGVVIKEKQAPGMHPVLSVYEEGLEELLLKLAPTQLFPGVYQDAVFRALGRYLFVGFNPKTGKSAFHIRYDAARVLSLEAFEHQAEKDLALFVILLAELNSTDPDNYMGNEDIFPRIAIVENKKYQAYAFEFILEKVKTPDLEFRERLDQTFAQFVQDSKDTFDQRYERVFDGYKREQSGIQWKDFPEEVFLSAWRCMNGSLGLLDQFIGRIPNSPEFALVLHAAKEQYCHQLIKAEEVRHRAYHFTINPANGGRYGVLSSYYDQAYARSKELTPVGRDGVLKELATIPDSLMNEDFFAPLPLWLRFQYMQEIQNPTTKMETLIQFLSFMPNLPASERKRDLDVERNIQEVEKEIEEVLNSMNSQSKIRSLRDIAIACTTPPSKTAFQTLGEKCANRGQELLYKALANEDSWVYKKNTALKLPEGYFLTLAAELLAGLGKAFGFLGNQPKVQEILQKLREFKERPDLPKKTIAHLLSEMVHFSAYAGSDKESLDSLQELAASDFSKESPTLLIETIKKLQSDSLLKKSAAFLNQVTRIAIKALKDVDLEAIQLDLDLLPESVHLAQIAFTQKVNLAIENGQPVSEEKKQQIMAHSPYALALRQEKEKVSENHGRVLSEFIHRNQDAQSSFQAAESVTALEDRDYTFITVFKQALTEKKFKLARESLAQVESLASREGLSPNLVNGLLEAEETTPEEVLEAFCLLKDDQTKQIYSADIVRKFYQKNRVKDAQDLANRISTQILESSSHKETKTNKFVHLISKIYEFDILHSLELFYKIPTIPGGKILKNQQELAKELCSLVDQKVSDEEFEKNHKYINNLFYHAKGIPRFGEIPWNLPSLAEKLERYSRKRKESN